MCVFPSGALYIYLQTSVAGFACSCDLRLLSLSSKQSHISLITNSTSRNYQISFFQSKKTIIDLKNHSQRMQIMIERL